jgi:hypothetical protein
MYEIVKILFIFNISSHNASLAAEQLFNWEDSSQGPH